MQMMERIRPLRKPLLVGAALVIALGAAGVLTAFAASGDSGDTETVYRETTVARGNLTVGINESGTASVDALSVTSEVDAEVLEVYVKAGQKVNEGDAIAKLDLDDVNDSLETLQADLGKANASLLQAQLDQQVGIVTAQYTYEINVENENVAPLQYDIDVDQLDEDLSSTSSRLDDIIEKIDTYEHQLNSSLKEDYQIDSKKAALETATANYNSALEALQQAQGTIGASLDELQLAVDNAKLTMDEAQSSYDKALSEYNRAYSDTEEKLDSAEEEKETASLQYQQARNNLVLDKLEARQQLALDLNTAENAQLIYDITVTELENSVISAKLNVKELERQIEDMQGYATDGVVYAPCSGTVMSVSVSAGDDVTAGGAIATISNPEKVYALVAISQDDIADVELGKATNLVFDAFSEETFTGEVDSIATSPARTGSGSVSYTVTILVDGDTSKIYEGMTCDITFIKKEVQDVLYVSNRAVTAEGSQQYVKVKDENGEIQRVEVTTGFSDGRNVEIQSGLSEGDVVLIESQVSTN